MVFASCQSLRVSRIEGDAGNVVSGHGGAVTWMGEEDASGLRLAVLSVRYRCS